MRCVEEFDQYIPPLWVMCLESVAHLLVLFKIPINIIIIIMIVIIIDFIILIVFIIIIVIIKHYCHHYDYIFIIGHAELLNQLPHLLLSLSALQKGTHQGGVDDDGIEHKMVMVDDGGEHKGRVTQLNQMNFRKSSMGGEGQIQSKN